MRQTWTVVGMGVVAAVAAAAAWMIGALPPPDGLPDGRAPAPEARPPRPLNVLLITLDTTRADRLGCYGYTAGATPALDALAARGVRYTRAFAHVPLTLPSHATMLTGLLPPEHGLRDNGRGKLAPAVETLAEIFRGHGWRTAAFLAAFVLDSQFGLGQGFGVYDDRLTRGTGTENVFDREERGDVVADRALDWLGKNADGRFFCWVHFYDPHLPYEPPAPYRTHHRHPYDGEIAFMDAQVKRLADFLDARGLWDNTLVIVAGDHGEAFAEHNEHGHGALVYNTTLHVPLIVVPPGRRPAGKNVDRVVGLVDIFPTVLEAVGVTPPNGTGGHDLLADPDAERPCYGESHFLYNSHGWAPLYALTTRRWKYIRCPRPELYDLAADPHERTNLAERRAEVLARLRSQLEALKIRMHEGEAARLELDPEAVARLQELGYLSRPATLPPKEVPAARRKDPKDMMDLYNACTRAGELSDAKRHRQAAALLKPMIAKSPESLGLHEGLVRAYLALKDYRAALPHIQACLALDPGNRPMVANLGEVQLQAGQYDAAARTLRRAVRMPPDPRIPKTKTGESELTIKLYVHLGITLAGQGKPQDAIRQYHRALKHVPDHLEANNNLAKAYVEQKQNALAIRHLRRVVRVEPQRYEPHKVLGDLLRKEKEYAAAIAAWRGGLKARPEDPALLYEIAWQLATCPDPTARDGRQAVRTAERLCNVLGWDHVQALDTLAAAQAEVGEWATAVKTARKALRLGREKGAAEFAREIERRLRLYQASKPYRE